MPFFASARRLPGPVFNLLALILLVCLFVGRLWLLPSLVSLDHNEGWNAFQAQAAVGSGQLYPAPDALNANNYPPLSFYIVGTIGERFGDMVVAGRVIALLSMGFVGFAIHRLVRLLVPGDRFAPWIGVAVFAGFNATVFRAYVGMDDPQWLGHAFVVAGLLVLLWKRPEPQLPLSVAACSALLMMLGVLVKHNLVATPAAAGVWLLVNDRRALKLWVVLGAVAAAMVLLLDRFVFHGNMLADIFMHDRAYSLRHMLITGAVALLYLPFIAVIRDLFGQRLRDPRIALLLYGIALAVPVGVIESCGEGVDVNAHFEALILVSIAFPVALSLRGRRLSRMVVLAPVLLTATWAGVANAREIVGREAAITHSKAIITRIAATQGPAACETLALCYWAGKDFEVDFFANRQRLTAGRGHRKLNDALNAHDFAVIQLESSAMQDPDDTVSRMVVQHYRPVLVTMNTVLLAP